MLKSTPKDVQVMAAVLKELGVEEYEPRVLTQIIEMVYRYVTEVLEEAKGVSTHSSKKGVDAADVRLAIGTKMDHSFVSPPPRELLCDLAKAKNSIPLPPVKRYSGVSLPPDRYCLTAVNYRLKAPKTVGLSLQARLHAAAAGGVSAGAPHIVTHTVPPRTTSIIPHSQIQLKPSQATLLRQQPGLSSHGVTIRTTPAGTTATPGTPTLVTLQTSQGMPTSITTLPLSNPLKRKREDGDLDV